MPMSRSERVLVAYSGVLTAAVAVMLLTGAASDRKAAFTEIDVERINIREPDGTLRMTISNMARFPGFIFRDRQYTHDRDVAGALFFNDEGTENGGLVFAGATAEDGAVTHAVHLSMDQYQQDQVVALNNIERNGQRRSGLTIGDRPERSIAEDFEERDALEAMDEEDRTALLTQRHADGYYGVDRVFVGRTGERVASMDLADASGQVRLRLKVDPDGAAAIEFVDAAGEVSGRVTPETLASPQRGQ